MLLHSSADLNYFYRPYSDAEAEARACEKIEVARVRIEFARGRYLMLVVGVENRRTPARMREKKLNLGFPGQRN